MRLGISPHLKGFRMLRLALLYLLAKPEYEDVQMMSELYPAIAAQTGRTVSMVEHSTSETSVILLPSGLMMCVDGSVAFGQNHIPLIRASENLPWFPAREKRFLPPASHQASAAS